MEFVKKFSLRSSQQTPEDEKVAQPTSPYPNEKEKGGSVAEDHGSTSDSQRDDRSLSSDEVLNPGTLSFEEGMHILFNSRKSSVQIYSFLTKDVAGGMGRHLGVFSCTMLMYAFDTPRDIYNYNSSLISPELVASLELGFSRRRLPS